MPPAPPRRGAAKNPPPPHNHVTRNRLQNKGLLAKKLRLESLEASKGKIVLTLDSRARIPQESFDWLMQYTKGNLKFLSPLSTAIDTEQEEWDGLVEELNTILQGLLNASEDAVQV